MFFTAAINRELRSSWVLACVYTRCNTGQLEPITNRSLLDLGEYRQPLMAVDVGVSSKISQIRDVDISEARNPAVHAVHSESSQLLTADQVAKELGVSISWVRRHTCELPVVRLGRLVRFDSSLLFSCSNVRLDVGNRSKPERSDMTLQFRRYQRGSLYKRGTRIKKWYGMWREDVRLPDGSTQRRQRNICLGPMSELPTRSAAFAYLAELMQMKPEKTGMELTFEDLTEKWKAAVVPTLKTSTASYYLKILRSNIIPAFGKWGISTIGRYDVECFLAEQAQRYTRNTLRGLRVSLSQVLAWGVACDYLSKNPCSGVKLPRAGTKIVRTVLTPQQVVDLSERLQEPYATLVLFLAVTGLRIGEAIGIKWSDFDGDVLHICRRVYEGEVDSTKTKGSDRHLPIPKSLLLRMQMLGSDGWVFRSRKGTTINPGNALKRYIRPIAKELGIPLGGWHDFRHTLTTGLLRGHVSAKVVSNILGHSDVKITLDTYCHTEVSDFREPLHDIAAQLLPDVMKSAFRSEPCTD